MKNYYLRTLALFVALFGMLTIQSCDTDPCSDVDCGSNGTCFDGTCACDPGYDGTNCGIVIRSLFTGTFDASEVCDTSEPGTSDDYVSVISEAFEGPEYIIIDNIYNFAADPYFNVQPEDAAVLASVSNTGGEYIVLIEGQGFTSGILPNYEIIGQGTYNPATAQITLEYSITDLDEAPDSEYYSDYCTVVYTPR